MTKPRYETTLGGAALALLAGAVCGGALITTLFLGPRAFAGRLGWSWTTDAALVVGLYASIWFTLFGFGLLFLAAPVLWLLHRLGQRSRVQAVVLGVTLTLVSYVAYSEYSRNFRIALFYGPAPIGGSLRAGYWPMMLEGAVWFAIVGGLVGLVIWRIAYRWSASEQQQD